MTTEERLDKLDITVRNHDAMFNLLISILERQEAAQDRQQAAQDRQQEILEQVQRDGQKTQRLWVNLCRKYGWLEDEDL